MRDPLWRLKTLPWVTLLQNGLLTVLLATLLDIALIGLLTAWPQGLGSILGGGLGQTLLLLLASGGIGALSVILMERLFRHVILDAATLWALVVCLAVILYLKTLLPIPSIFVGFSYLQFIGLVFGLFSQGRAYWRR